MSEDTKSVVFLESIPKTVGIMGIIFCLFLMAGFLFSNEKGFLGDRMQLFSFFKIKQIRVSSEWPISNSEVKAWLPHLEGRSLVALNVSDLVASLEKKTWVEQVVIKKQYPDHLWIELETKRPRALSTVQGIAYFVDEKGNVIEKARPGLLKTLDLPFISFSSTRDRWDVSQIFAMADQFKKLARSKYSISQIILGNYPYFKIFLENPKIEVLLNIENWQSQSKVLETLLLDPPSQIQQLQRINLMFPKKAVVSIHN
jgi:cell division septal protein FtsQ